MTPAGQQLGRGLLARADFDTQLPLAHDVRLGLDSVCTAGGPAGGCAELPPAVAGHPDRRPSGSISSRMNACRTTLTESMRRNRIWGLGNMLRSIVVPYRAETLITNTG